MFSNILNLPMSGPRFEPINEAAFVTIAQLLYRSFPEKSGSDGMAFPRSVPANGLPQPVMVCTCGSDLYKSQTSFCGELPVDGPLRPLKLTLYGLSARDLNTLLSSCNTLLSRTISWFLNAVNLQNQIF